MLHLFTLSMLPLATKPSSTQCDNVRQSYQDIGCCDSLPTQKPGWAGMMCTTIVKTTPAYNKPMMYASVGMRFSADGTSVDMHITTPGKPQSYYLDHRYDWPVFSTVMIDKYQINRTIDDPHFFYSLPQKALDQKGKSLAYSGYQLNGMRFSDDFSRGHQINAGDWYTSEATRKILEAFSPIGYFGTYTGSQWIKDPYYLCANGDLDEDKNTHKYFTCKAY